MDILLQVFQCIQGTPVRLTRGLHLLWTISPDLQAQFLLDTTSDMLAFCVYVEDVLLKEYPMLSVLDQPDEREYMHTPQGDEYLAITPYMQGLLRSRKYLQSIDLKTPKGRLSLWQHTCMMTNLLNMDPSFYKRCLHVSVYEDHIGFPLPLLIYFAVQKHLYIFPVLKTLRETCKWLIDNAQRIDCGLDKSMILHLASWLYSAPDFLFDPGGVIRHCRNAFLSRHLNTGRKSRAAQKLKAWFCHYGGEEIEVGSTSTRIKESWKEKQEHIKEFRMRTTDLIDGINVIGYGFSELGLGEDARCAISNCDAAGIPSVLYNVPMAITSRSGNRFYASRVDDSLPHKINLYCLSLPEFARALLIMHPDSRVGRYQIVAPPWELSHCPKELMPCLEFADEFWAPSRFIATALEEGTRKTVLHMPHSVTLPKPSHKKRTHFGLPEDSFLFLFIFDWLSWPQRKNPEAVIRAFQQAFSRQDNCGLVIKTMNARRNKEKICELIPQYELGKRFYIIDETLVASDISALYRCCNAYVSLHRAEGFGRTIAEAMLAKLPVIVTNYSGNKDFCAEDTAFLVNGPLKPLREGDYLFWKDQQWCDPSIEEASVCMRQCASDVTLALDKSIKAFNYINKHHSVEAVGVRYRQRFTMLTNADQWSGYNLASAFPLAPCRSTR